MVVVVGSCGWWFWVVGGCGWVIGGCGWLVVVGGWWRWVLDCDGL